MSVRSFYGGIGEDTGTPPPIQPVDSNYLIFSNLTQARNSNLALGGFGVVVNGHISEYFYQGTGLSSDDNGDTIIAIGNRLYAKSFNDSNVRFFPSRASAQATTEALSVEVIFIPQSWDAFGGKFVYDSKLTAIDALAVDLVIGTRVYKRLTGTTVYLSDIGLDRDVTLNQGDRLQALLNLMAVGNVGGTVVCNTPISIGQTVDIPNHVFFEGVRGASGLITLLNGSAGFTVAKLAGFSHNYIEIPSSVVKYMGKVVTLKDALYRVDNNCHVEGNYIKNNCTFTSRGTVINLTALMALDDTNFSDKDTVNVTQAFVRVFDGTWRSSLYRLERNPNENESIGSDTEEGRDFDDTVTQNGDIITTSVPTASGNGRWVFGKAVSGTAFYLESAGETQRNVTFVQFVRNYIENFENAFYSFSAITKTIIDPQSGLPVEVGITTWNNSNTFYANRTVGCKYHYYFKGDRAVNRNIVRGALCEMNRYVGHYAFYLEGNSAGNVLDCVIWDSFGKYFEHKTHYLGKDTFDNRYSGWYNGYKVKDKGWRNLPIGQSADHGSLLVGTILPKGRYTHTNLPQDNFLLNIYRDPDVTITYTGPVPGGLDITGMTQPEIDAAILEFVKRPLSEAPSQITWDVNDIDDTWVQIDITYPDTSRFADDLQKIGAIFDYPNTPIDYQILVEQNGVWILKESITNQENAIILVDCAQSTGPGLQNVSGIRFRFKGGNGDNSLILKKLFAYGGEVVGGGVVTAASPDFYGGFRGLGLEKSPLKRLLNDELVIDEASFYNWVRIGTETVYSSGPAIVDTLDTISPVIDGGILFLSLNLNNEKVTLVDTGNIILPEGATSVEMLSNDDLVMLFGDATLGKWKVFHYRKNQADVSQPHKGAMDLANDFATFSTTFVDTGLSFQPKANTYYLIRTFGALTTGLAANGYAFTVDTGGAGFLIGQARSSITSTTMGGIEITSSGASGSNIASLRAAGAPAPGDTWFLFKTMSSPGVLKLQLKSEGAGANNAENTITMLANKFLMVYEEVPIGDFNP